MITGFNLKSHCFLFNPLVDDVYIGFGYFFKTFQLESFTIFTACKRSLGQGNFLMFSERRVSHSVHMGVSLWCHFLSGCLVPCSFWDLFPGGLCPGFSVCGVSVLVDLCQDVGRPLTHRNQKWGWDTSYYYAFLFLINEWLHHDWRDFYCSFLWINS